MITSRRALAFVVALAGCGAAQKPTVTVVTQAQGNPLRGVKSFRFSNVTVENFRMGEKTEADWLAKRSPEQQAAWANDKAKLTDRIFERLQVEAGDGAKIARGDGPLNPGEFAIAINFDKYVEEMGLMAGTFQGTLKILDASGQVVDEVRLPVREGGGILALALNTFVTWAAADTVEYLKSRTRTEEP